LKNEEKINLCANNVKNVKKLKILLKSLIFNKIDEKLLNIDKNRNFNINSIKSMKNAIFSKTLV